MSSRLLLMLVAVQSVLGTFPPVDNPPPIPGQTIRTLDILPQRYYLREDVNEQPPVPNVRDGPIPLDSSSDQRWFIQERRIEENESPSSSEGYDRFYPNGELAIGPVATPKPDDVYDAQPSSVSKVNPQVGTVSRTPDIYIVSRGINNNQYASGGWIQVPSERFVEVVNQDSDPPVATDIVKSLSAPLPQVQGKSQIASPGNVIQQILLRKPDDLGSQKVVLNQPTVLGVPSAKQVAAPAPPNFIQKQVVKDSYSYTAPSPTSSLPQPFPVKKPFTVPPPPAPPVKGNVIVPKSLTSVLANPVPGPNILLTDKSGLLQQLRHIWVPTSSRTGRFVTIPVSSAILGKSLGIDLPIDSTPVSVSDTWVLKTDGSIPSFEQQRSLIPPPAVQTGKKVFADSSVIQIDSPSISKSASVIGTPKSIAIVRNVVNSPVDIWPVRNDIANSKSLDKAAAALPLLPPTSAGVTGVKSILPPLSLVTAQKSVVANTKFFPPTAQFNTPAYSIVNGKPCPIAPQYSLPVSKTEFTVPPPLSRILVTQNKQPLTRVVRVNRFPTGSYYLLNTRVSPNIASYQNPALFQQSKLGTLGSQKPLSLPIQPVQSKQPLIQPTKQAGIPAQQVISSKTPQRLIIYSLPTLAKTPLFSRKSSRSLISAAFQGLRHIYPINGYLNSSPAQLPGPVFPQPSPLTVRTVKKSSTSSSSESSSSEESSEEKKESVKKEESSEPEENSKELEKESSEESKVESGDSTEAAETQIHSQVKDSVTQENLHAANSVSNASKI